MSLLDAVNSLGRVAGVGLALTLDLPGARRRHFPVTLAELTPAWLERALGGRFPGIEVEGFEVLEGHSGTTSRARLALRYRGQSSAAIAPPERLFLKLTPPQLAHRIFLVTTGIGRCEVRFYSGLSGQVPVRVPEIYAAESIGDGRYFALLLEDLTGDDVRFSQVGDRLGLDDAQRVVASLAALHAAFWQSPRFDGDLAWVPCLENRRRQMPWERFVTSQMIGLTRRRFGAEFDGGVEDVAALCAGNRDGLEQLWSMGDRTLIHGDCHVGNLFFEPDGVGFLDWQVCARAPGMRDVSYFLCNSFPSELRAQHERELIEGYLGELRRLGVAAPGFDEAWSQHRLFALYTWIAAAFTAAAGGALQPPEIGLAGLRRATRAVDELDSVAHVRELETGRTA